MQYLYEPQRALQQQRHDAWKETRETRVKAFAQHLLGQWPCWSVSLSLSQAEARAQHIGTTAIRDQMDELFLET